WTQEQQPTISHFSAMPFDERLASRGTDTFLRELGFEDHRWKFNEFILTGQLDALDTDQLEIHTSVGRLLNYQAKQTEIKHYREEAASA
ncbi:regulator, partial [Escherichia coli]|nr:regulator [Escherichia coli]